MSMDGRHVPDPVATFEIVQSVAARRYRCQGG